MVKHEKGNDLAGGLKIHLAADSRRNICQACFADKDAYSKIFLMIYREAKFASVDDLFEKLKGSVLRLKGTYSNIRAKECLFSVRVQVPMVPCCYKNWRGDIMLAYLKLENNKTLTENGAATHKTTGSDMLDLFATIGALRNSREDEPVYLRWLIQIWRQYLI